MDSLMVVVVVFVLLNLLMDEIHGLCERFILFNDIARTMFVANIFVKPS
jgi:hypothetical protein